jgi:NitT/TauT family transport system ATP-binding protein
MMHAENIRRSVATRDGAMAVLDGLSLSLKADEIVALVGPSGCGKTTFLRILGGLEQDFDGRITWQRDAAPAIGTVFQEPRLLPWRSIRQNIELVRAPQAPTADALLEELDLAAFARAYPRTLSLGMQRRVALARALSVQPDLLLLDEPFVSLDPVAAERGRDVLLRAWRARGCAVLLVTHDLAEAGALADRILILSNRPARVLKEHVVPHAQRRAGIAAGARFAASLIGTPPA